jgi:hypothetical protein
MSDLGGEVSWIQVGDETSEAGDVAVRCFDLSEFVGEA